MPGTEPNTRRAVSLLSFTTTLWGGCCYYTQFTDEVSEAQRLSLSRATQLSRRAGNQCRSDTQVSASFSSFRL